MKLRYTTRKQVMNKLRLSKYDNLPVHVIPGSAQPPILKGEYWHYETKTGIPIRHPSAYSKKGWSSMCYVCSSREVYVGEHWNYEAMPCE